MSEFINTIDVLGDDAVIDSIIQRTITEFKDNRVNKVGQRAFASCKALETVELPNATDIAMSAFQGCAALSRVVIPRVTRIDSDGFGNCTALERVELPSVGQIMNYVFAQCNNLTALILSNGSVTKMNQANSLQNTPIASGTGYIYVPKALVDSYKSATNWSTYANQIRAIEDYPEITGG